LERIKTKQKGNNGNTYNVGAQCSAFHPVCNKNTNRVMRGQYKNNILNFKDLRGVKAKNGCCACGAGSGGTPSYGYPDPADPNSIKHKTCQSLKLQACGDGDCGNESSSGTFMDACTNPPIPTGGTENSQLQKQLKQYYDKVVESNSIMKTKAEFLFSKLNLYEKQLQKLNSERNNEDETFQQIMDNYNKTRKELEKMNGMVPNTNTNTNPNETYTDMMEAQKIRMGKDWTRNVMVKESELRRKSEEMQFWMWTVLAIVVGWATIINFRKKTS